MLIYNVTSQISWSIEKQWVEWMLDFHIPAILGTGCFARHQFVKVLEIDETEGPTYAVQYFADTLELYNEYINQYSGTFSKEAIARWGSLFISFKSVMKVIN